MQNIYITTPIYYVNDNPHIGHAYTSIVCDVLSRYYKLKKNTSVKFLTGTDEHGQKVENAAKINNKKPQEFVDLVSKNFKNLTEVLNISNSDFIRTSEFRHKKTVEIVWNRLVERKQIYLGKYEGWYSIKDEAFYQEKELNKVDGDFQTQDGTKVEWLKEESYFFKLSNWQNKLLEFYDKNIDFIKPSSRRNEVISFVKNGLRDLSVSRTSFSWGIKVPNHGSHVIYVWIDALTNYLSAIKYPESFENENYWKNSIHIIGKDILKFHAIYWPAILMAADLTPPKQIFAHGWWTNEGKKISKSLNKSIDPLQLIDKYGLDQLRYFLLREVTLGQDGDFSEKSFIKRVNSDLSNNLGNLIQRTLKLLEKHFDNKIPSKISELKNVEILFDTYKLATLVKPKIENFEYNKALESIFNHIDKLNQFIDNEKPWESIKKNDLSKASETLSTLIECFRVIAVILIPFIPDSAKKILDTLNVDSTNMNFDSLNIKFCLKKGEKINKIEKLFPRYDEKHS